MINILKFLWCLPNTIIGFIFGLASLGLPNKLWVVESRWGFAWLLNKVFKSEAICLGYVIIHYREIIHCEIIQCRGFAGCKEIHQKYKPILYADYCHELVHRKQQCQWGIFWFIAYVIFGFIAISEGKHFYWDNYFEIEAYRRQNDPD